MNKLPAHLVKKKDKALICIKKYEKPPHIKKEMKEIIIVHSIQLYTNKLKIHTKKKKILTKLEAFG